MDLELSADAGELLVQWALFARDRGPVVLAGAGLTMNARPARRWRERASHRIAPPRAKTWGELAADFRTALGIVAGGMHSEKDESDPLWLAELVEQHVGRARLIQIVCEAVPQELLEPDEVHRAFVRVPWKHVFTLNYDDLIERAYVSELEPREVQTLDDDVSLVHAKSDDHAVKVVHVHGSFRKPHEIVITLEDYRRFERERAGMLAKVRQAFLQHPALLIGFGVTDPNFVRWSGWIGDVAGSYRPPMLCLNVGRSPSSPRRSFWSGRVTFLDLTSQRLAGVLDALADFFSPVTSGGELLDTREAIASATSPQGVVDALSSGLASLAATGWRTLGLEQQLTDAALVRALQLHHRDDAEAARLAGALQGIDRETSEQIVALTGTALGGETEHLSTEAKRQIVREAFGRAWPTLLCELYPYFGLRPYFRQSGFDLRDELGRIDSANGERLRRLLAWDEVQERVRRTGAGEVAAERDFDQRWSLTEAERRELRELRARAALGSGESIDVEVHEGSAAELRRRGFVLSLRGDQVGAWEAYRLAAERCRAEGADPIDEWITVRSALYLSRWADSGKQPSPIARRSVERFQRRKRQLESTYERLRWLKDDANQARASELDFLRQLLLTRSAGPRAATQVYEAAPVGERLLDYAEHFWAAPYWCADIAKIVGWGRVLRGDLASGLDVLLRYGWKDASEILAVARLGSVHELPMDSLMDVLLRSGRWPGEWAATMEAFAAVAYLVRPSDVPRAVAWLCEAGAHLEELSGDVTRGAGISSQVQSHARELGTAISNLLLVAEPGDMDNLRSHIRVEQEPWSRLAMAIARAHAPWMRWVSSGGLAWSDVWTHLAEALDDAMSINDMFGTPTRIVSRAYDLHRASGESWSDRLVQSIRSWLQSQMVDEEIAALIAMRVEGFEPLRDLAVRYPGELLQDGLSRRSPLIPAIARLLPLVETKTRGHLWPLVESGLSRDVEDVDASESNAPDFGSSLQRELPEIIAAFAALDDDVASAARQRLEQVLEHRVEAYGALLRTGPAALEPVRLNGWLLHLGRLADLDVSRIPPNPSWHTLRALDAMCAFLSHHDSWPIPKTWISVAVRHAYCHEARLTVAAVRLLAAGARRCGWPADPQWGTDWLAAVARASRSNVVDIRAAAARAVQAAQAVPGLQTDAAEGLAALASALRKDVHLIVHLELAGQVAPSGAG